MPKRPDQIVLTLPPQQRERLDTIREASGRSRNELIREAIERYLETKTMSTKFMPAELQTGRFEVYATCDALSGRYMSPEGSLMMRTDDEDAAVTCADEHRQPAYVLDTEDETKYYPRMGWVPRR